VSESGPYLNSLPRAVELCGRQEQAVREGKPCGQPLHAAGATALPLLRSSSVTWAGPCSKPF